MLERHILYSLVFPAFPLSAELYLFSPRGSPLPRSHGCLNGGQREVPPGPILAPLLFPQPHLQKLPWSLPTVMCPKVPSGAGPASFWVRDQWASGEELDFQGCIFPVFQPSWKCKQTLLPFHNPGRRSSLVFGTESSLPGMLHFPQLLLGFPSPVWSLSKFIASWHS